MTPNWGEKNNLLDHQGKLAKKHARFLYFSGPLENLLEMVPKRVKVIFPTNQDPTNILGRTDFHSDKLHFLYYVWIPDLQIPGFLDSQMARFKASARDSRRILRSDSAVAPQ